MEGYMLKSVWFGALAASISLIGCDGGTGTGTDTDDTNNTECTNPATAYPINAAATDFYYRGTVEATLTTVEDDATITVADGAGTEVAGTTSWRGNTLVWEANDGLAPSTAYTATLSYSCGDVDWQFTTSDVGGAVTTPGDLVGNAYQLDIAGARFIEPAGIGSALGSFLTFELYVGVTAVDGADLEMIGALGADGAQDVCEATIPFPTSDFANNPYFEVGPQDTTIVVQGYPITLMDLFISGSFAADGSAIAGAELNGSVDTREIVDIYQEGAADDTICQLAEGLGVSCEACGDGQELCLTIVADSINANVEDFSLEVLTDEDVDANEDCDTGA